MQNSKQQKHLLLSQEGLVMGGKLQFPVIGHNTPLHFSVDIPLMLPRGLLSGVFTFVNVSFEGMCCVCVFVFGCVFLCVAAATSCRECLPL